MQLEHVHYTIGCTEFFYHVETGTNLQERVVARKLTHLKFKFILVMFILVMLPTLASRFPTDALAATLCGEGSAPDYGLDYSLRQPHWTVGWEDYVSEDTVNQVDVILDQLNADSIAQTMILFKPQEEVGNRVNCAVHFLRYMELGLPTGERKDNGFVFLIVVEPEGIDVHYGVGLGLPALTAYELTSLNREAEQTYQSTHSMDESLLTLVQGFDKVAHENYAPLSTPTPESDFADQPRQPSGPLDYLGMLGQCCIGIFALFFFLWMFTQRSTRGGGFYNPGGGWFPRGTGFPRGGGGGFGGRSGPSSRGGSGSGRSGRGN
jgi:hypothetical protein